MACGWRPMLNKALEANSSVPYSKFFQLATVKTSGKPACRTVVFRGFHKDTNAITFVTDTRTPKTEQLHDNAAAEVCWYFTESREQFRLAGELKLVGADHPDEELVKARDELWKHIGPGTKAWFAWPTSGDSRHPDESVFDREAPEEVLETFALAILDVAEVDYVLLPRERKGFYSEGTCPEDRTWREAPLNP